VNRNPSVNCKRRKASFPIVPLSCLIGTVSISYMRRFHLDSQVRRLACLSAVIRKVARWKSHPHPRNWVKYLGTTSHFFIANVGPRSRRKLAISSIALDRTECFRLAEARRPYKLRHLSTTSAVWAQGRNALQSNSV
jgi:hypothetical protein